MSAAPVDNPIVLNIFSSYGALLIGTFLSQAIWGISTMQTFLYYKNYEEDPLYLKALVALLWLIDTADQILIMKGDFRVLVLQYGRIAGLREDQGELIYHTWLETIVIFVVQAYFIRRIFVFGNTLGEKLYKPIVGLCILLMILAAWQPTAIIIYWVWSYGKPLAVQGEPRAVNLNISLRATAVVCDILIAAAMVWLLSTASVSALAKTKRIMFRILVITINSGTWTAITALIVLILIKTHPGTLIYCTLELTLCSLYFSTFLANLNARNFVKAGTYSGGQSISGSDLPASHRTDTLVLSPLRAARTPQTDTLDGVSGDSTKITIYNSRHVYENDVHINASKLTV